jgi:hypothetical protein
VREAVIQKLVRLAVCQSGRAIVVRNSVGFDKEHKVKYGLGVGSPDLVGMLIPSGRVFCLEIKTETGVVSPEQKLWAAACRRYGGFCTTVRSVHAAMSALERAEHGESE